MFLIHNKTAEVDITLIDITNCAKKCLPPSFATIIGSVNNISEKSKFKLKFQKVLDKNSPQTGNRLHSKFKWEAKSPG